MIEVPKKRIIKKIRVKEITLASKDFTPQNNEPLLLIKATPNGGEMNTNTNTNNQATPTQNQNANTPPVATAATGKAEPMFTAEQIKALNEANLMKLESVEGRSNAQDVGIKNEIDKLKQKLQITEDKVNNMAPQTQNTQQQPPTAQPAQQPTQPNQVLPLPLQTQQAAELAGINIQDNQQNQAPNQTQQNQTQPTVNTQNNSQIQQPQFQTPPAPKPNDKQTPDVFTSDKNNELKKKSVEIYNEYKTNHTKNPWEMAERLENLTQ